MKLEEVYREFRAAFEAANIRFFEVGETPQPPAAGIALARVEWNGPGAEPTDAQYALGLVVPAGPDAQLELVDLIRSAQDALDGASVDAVVREGTTATLSTFPAFVIEIEVALS